jgi:23S rRNA pseudouridine1911/1915/1917 synthase
MPEGSPEGADAAAPGREIVVPEEGEGSRLDRFLAGTLPEVSRQRIQSLLRAGRILLDGQRAKPSTRLSPGQRIQLPSDLGPEPTPLRPEPVPLQILYEDEDLLVVHKPAGLVVHPGAGVRHGTLVHGLLHHLPGWPGVGGKDRPGIVHRLDRGTSGLLVVAKSPRAYASLTRQIRQREVQRRYVALAWGQVRPPAGRIELPIGRDPRHRHRMAAGVPGGREAVTEYECLAAFDTLTLLRLSLRTGRTHQIRVHLAARGHPVFGDATYGGGKAYLRRLAPADRPRHLRWLRSLGRPALHAYHLGFRHPADGQWLVFEAPVPRDMEEILEELAATGYPREVEHEDP